MRWTKKFSLYLLLPVFVLLAAAVALHLVSRLNSFSSRVEGLLEAATGREIKIAGGIETNLFQTNPSVVLNDVTIANPNWASRPDFAKVARLKLEARWWPILAGEVRVQRITAEGLRIWFETDATGRGNWQLAIAKPGKDEPKKPLDFEELRLFGIKLIFQNGSGTPESQAAINTLTVSKTAGGDRAVLRTRGSVDDMPFEIEAESVPLTSILEGKPSRMKLSAKFGASDVTGTSTLTLGTAIRIEAALQSKRLVVGPRTDTARSTSNKQRVGTPKTRATAKTAPASRAGSTPIPTKLIQRLALNVTFAVERLELGGITLMKASGALTGEKGKLVINPLRAVHAGTALTGTVSLDARRKPAQLAMAVGASGIDVKNIETYSGGPVIARGRLDLSVRAGSAGDSIEALQRHFKTTVSAKLSKATVVGLPWRPRGSRTEVPRLDVALTVSGPAAPSRLRSKTETHKVAPRSKASSKKTTAPALAATFAQLRGRPLGIQLNGVFGRSDIAGTLALRIGARMQISGTLTSNRLDLGAMANSGAKREPLFDPDPLPIDLIRTVQGEIKYRIARVEFDGIGIPNIASTVSVRDRVLTVRSSGTGADTARLLITMDARGPTARTTLDFRLADTGLATVIAGTAGFKAPQGSVGVHVRLAGTGSTVKSAIGGASGQAVFVLRTSDSEKGTGWIAGLGRGFVGTIATVVTRRGGNLRCIVARTPIVNGVGKSEVLLIDTERLSFFGQGALDLRHETVDALFVPRQKSIGFSRIKLFTVRMTGPIDRPKAQLDFGAAAVETAKSTIKIAWLPVTLLGKLFSGELRNTLRFDPCPLAIKKARGVANE